MEVSAVQDSFPRLLRRILPPRLAADIYPESPERIAGVLPGTAVEDLLRCDKCLWFYLHDSGDVKGLEGLQAERVLRHWMGVELSLSASGSPSPRLYTPVFSGKQRDTAVRRLAILRWAGENSGIAGIRCIIGGIDRGCRYPDISNIVIEEDVTADTEPYAREVPSWMDRIGLFGGMAEAPSVPLGDQCGSPRVCRYLKRCGAFSGRHSIFSIPNLGRERRNELLKEGCSGIGDIPRDFSLNRGQRNFIRSRAPDEIRFDFPKIAKELSSLSFPLAFLDFETGAPSVPLHPGMAPFETYPFQFSCHILTPEGGSVHHEYLHRGTSDPRRAVAEKLTACLPDEGSIVAYNAGFERSVTARLAGALPDLAMPLNRLKDRFFDLYGLIRNTISHPGFEGSYSLKSILPVLVPALSYADLPGVKEGSDAILAWDSCLRERDSKKKEALERSLLEYCALDTWALVEIYRMLARACGLEDVR